MSRPKAAYGRVVDARRDGRVKHGMAETSEFRIWSQMLGRCQNPKNNVFKYYGGRGIKVCERWKTFSLFLSDMGKRPSGLSLDRINNDGDYEPGNCRWATRKEQSRNSRKARILTVNGVSKCISEWSEVSGINPYAIVARKRLGWPDCLAVFQPIRAKRSLVS